MANLRVLVHDIRSGHSPSLNAITAPQLQALVRQPPLTEVFPVGSGKYERHEQ